MSMSPAGSSGPFDPSMRTARGLIEYIYLGVLSALRSRQSWVIVESEMQFGLARAVIEVTVNELEPVAVVEATGSVIRLEYIEL